MRGSGTHGSSVDGDANSGDFLSGSSGHAAAKHGQSARENTLRPEMSPRTGTDSPKRPAGPLSLSKATRPRRRRVRRAPAAVPGSTPSLSAIRRAEVVLATSRPFSKTASRATSARVTQTRGRNSLRRRRALTDTTTAPISWRAGMRISTGQCSPTVVSPLVTKPKSRRSRLHCPRQPSAR